MYLKCSRRIQLKDLNEMSLILDIRLIGVIFKILKKVGKRIQSCKLRFSLLSMNTSQQKEFHDMSCQLMIFKATVRIPYLC